MIGIESQCYSCAHFVVGPGGGRDGGNTGPTCSAFPSGVPESLLGNEADHRLPYPGDGGVRWTSDGHPFPEEVFELLRRLA